MGRHNNRPKKQSSWRPCISCGEKSLAQLTEHSCKDCAEDYQYCLDCYLEYCEVEEVPESSPWFDPDDPSTVHNLVRSAPIKIRTRDQ